jgi:hypothetical protein
MEDGNNGILNMIFVCFILKGLHLVKKRIKTSGHKNPLVRIYKKEEVKMANIKSVAKLDLKESVEDITRSCVKMFGDERAKEVLEKIYKGAKLKKALKELEKIDNEIRKEDIGNEDGVDINEVLEMNEIETNEQGEEIMTRKNVKEIEDVEIKHNGVDAMKDTRELVSDHGRDNKENTLQNWYQNAKNSELMPVYLKDVVNELDAGTVINGSVVRVCRFLDRFGKTRFAVNIQLQAIYSEKNHRGYLFETTAIYLEFKQFQAYCEEVKWNFDDMKEMRGEEVKIAIAYDADKKSNTYFLQSK